MEKKLKKGFKYYFLKIVSVLVVAISLACFARLVYYYYFDFSTPVGYFDVAIVVVLILFAILFVVLSYTDRSLTLQTMMLDHLLLRESQVLQLERKVNDEIELANDDVLAIKSVSDDLSANLDTLSERINYIRKYLNNLD